ncbi:flagellar motor switching and energizing component [Wigglesworthia glossinidia endosymbiont of Glossina morsitans morsitans (Yale colony)]|uniref:Flagellar motor switch protein FliN n=1 Tax=Wigglesworthia glossinidia endosymbiont of Glossina morsitans morsitans (Yale colony) TaxID=1142511 RepID=H6Q5L3_WIGGL|nr:flagellar motor switch protein FliN [Wigglesworthia glossinidia]AFA40917.1 flagellar motor switching and energizing component [Wigglesworthia glossinidia endosymbiont of Glossina morsitans morsitans (Yale colony)]
MNNINKELKSDDTKINEKKSTDSVLNQKETSENPSDNKIVASENIFENYDVEENNLNLILDIPIKMTIELGRKRMTIRDLLYLKKDAIVTLDGVVGEPLDILINNYLIARGEVVVMQEKYGIRISDIITPEERIRRLNR